MNIFNFIEHKDISILKTINISLKCRAFDYLMPFSTYLASNLFLSLFCIITLVSSNEVIHELGVKLAISLIISTIVAQLIKRSAGRRRPFISINDLNIRKIGIDKYSFPSGHTTAAFCTAVMVSLFFPYLSFILMVLAFLTGISRIYLGVHYPTDVAAGAILGLFISFLIYFSF